MEINFRGLGGAAWSVIRIRETAVAIMLKRHGTVVSDALRITSRFIIKEEEQLVFTVEDPGAAFSKVREVDWTTDAAAILVARKLWSLNAAAILKNEFAAVAAVRLNSRSEPCQLLVPLLVMSSIWPPLLRPSDAAGFAVTVRNS